MPTMSGLAPFIFTVVTYGAACLLIGVAFGYLLGATHVGRPRPNPPRHARPPSRRRRKPPRPAVGRL